MKFVIHNPVDLLQQNEFIFIICSMFVCIFLMRYIQIFMVLS